MNSNIRFGWLSGCAVLLALAADLFLVPALLTLTLRKKAALSHRRHPPRDDRNHPGRTGYTLAAVQTFGLTIVRISC